MTRARRAAARTALLGALLLVAPACARAQGWVRLDVPDSARAEAVRSLGTGYENAWNALFVEVLRAGRASPDGQRLWRLAGATAASERSATGGRIAHDALGSAARWSAAERARRVRAALAESLATAAQGARDWLAAEREFREALAGYRALGEKRREAWVLGSIGVALFSSGRIPEADSVYRQALVARRAVGDPRLVGNTLNALGSTRIRLGRFAEALPYLREARAVRMGTGERGPLGSTLNSLAAIAPSLGMPDSARGWFAEALALTTTAGDSTRTAEVLTNLAGFERGQGDAEGALPLLRRALAIFRQRGDPALESVNLVVTAQVLADAGRFTEAAVAAHAAGVAGYAAGDPRAVQAAAQQEAYAWVLGEDPARARAPLMRATSLADSLGDPLLIARAAQLAAQRARLDGDLTGAARGAARALFAATASGDSGVVRATASVAGQLAMDAGSFAEAERWFVRAAAIGAEGPPAEHVADLLNLGAVRSLSGRVAQAREDLERGRELAARSGARDLAWMIELGLGDVAERAGDRAEALARYRAAASLADSVRRRQAGEASVQVFARRTHAYGALVHLLGTMAVELPASGATEPERLRGQEAERLRGQEAERRRGLAKEAFAWAERAKARALIDLLARTRPNEPRPEPATLDDAQARLPDRATALLAYSVGDSSSALWVVRHDRWTLVTLPRRSALRARIEALRRAWGSPRLGATANESTRRVAQELSQAVWAPALPHLAGIRRLVIAPDGPLWLLPMDALPVGTRDATPIGARYAVSVVPAAALLGRGAAAHDARVLVVGDVRYGDTPVAGGAALTPLTETEGEVRALRLLVPNESLTALTGAAATSDSLRALLGSRARVLHLATHGDPREAEPEHSGLWLAADASGAPSRLEARDVLEHSLGADLVTLSACGTGLGRLAEGEGVLGLTRAFLAAGSGSVVVSLWNVSDQSTARLMSRFYEGLLRKGLPRDRALAEAKRALLAERATADPFHWAPFVLVGDPGPLVR